MGWFKRIFGKEAAKNAEAITEPYSEMAAACAVRQLSYEICVQRIAAAISKCEVQTFERGEEKRGELYYLLNIRPNPNQNATEFWSKLIHQIYYKTEALIVQPTPGAFFVADSFSYDDRVLKERTFKDIEIEKCSIKKTFKASECWHFKLNNERVRLLLAATLDLQEALLNSATSKYRKGNATKMKAKIDRARQGMPGFEDKIKQMMETDVKAFMSEKNACLIEYDGVTYDSFGSGGATGDTRDIKALIDDTLEITSKAFLMPVNIATGEVTDTSKAVDDFLTFCLDHVVELIQDELNAKGFSPAEYLEGTCIRINTNSIKHVDVLEMASAVDKLVSSGVFCIDDLRRILGEPELNTEWSKMHFMTKNYATVNNLIEMQEGGEKDGNEENAGDEQSKDADADVDRI